MLNDLQHYEKVLRALAIIGTMLIVSHIVLLALLWRTRHIYSRLVGESRGWQSAEKAGGPGGPKLTREAALIGCAYKLNNARTSAERENALAELSMHVARLREASEKHD